MSTIAEKVKKIIVEKLGVEESEVTPKPALLMIWALTHWTPLN